ncbi:serine protease [Rhodopirellula bahusiensis]|uniref:Serine protease n=1 Tax=Rhodopirellula bahusiensis TaxID=2014065 RepID=A0A2G1WAY3_9BACT|nr:serine protease [Rhodopirellula bahusiensis]
MRHSLNSINHRCVYETILRSRRASCFVIASTLQLRLMWALILCCFTPHLAHAQIKLDRVFPPAVAVGAETAVAAEGKFPNWPPNIDCDVDQVSISAGKDSGKLTVKVADDAAPGVAWIRFHDDQSMTALVPLILSSVDVFSETEPNDKRSEANPIELPIVVAGRLAKGGDSDAYRVSLKAGQTLVVSATANQVLKSPMDAVLQLTDLRGNVLFHSDDVRGLDPQIVFTADSDQELLIRIFAFPETPNSTIGYAGSASFIYTLDVTTGPFVDHVAADKEKAIAFGYNLDDATRTVSNTTESLSPPVAMIPDALGWSWVPPVDESVHRVLPGGKFDGTLPALLFGHFLKADETHHYNFKASKGTKYRAEVRSKTNGFLLDSKLTITDSKSGKTLASNDDMSSGGYDAGVDFTATEDGPIDVAVSEMLGEFGPRHFYQLSIRELKPECQLSMTEDHFVVTQSKPLELSVSVNRKSGFNSKVKIAATELPDGIQSDAVVSEPKGDTAKTVKLKLTAADNAIGHGRFRIVGTILDANDEPTEETTEATYNLRPSIPLTEFWLTVPPAPAKEASP